MASSRNNALEFSSVGSIVINAADGATAGTFWSYPVPEGFNPFSIDRY
jgi:hypothetical protein